MYNSLNNQNILYEHFEEKGPTGSHMSIILLVANNAILLLLLIYFESEYHIHNLFDMDGSTAGKVYNL